MILVIGEALIDLIQTPDAPDTWQSVVGGANANVALALAKRGTPHGFLGRISTDAFGQKIDSHLRSGGVNLDACRFVSEPSSLAVASLDARGVPTYAFYVNGTADWGWTLTELPSPHQLRAQGVKAVQFGCLTAALRPGSTAVAEWIQELHATRAVTLSHDLNLRPALGFRREEEQRRVEHLNRFSHVIKASEEDLLWLYGSSSASDADSIAERWTGSGAWVILTRGAAGATLFTRSEKLSVPGLPVTVKDTVGAGDVFIAHFLAVLLQGNALGEQPLERLNAAPEALLCAALEAANLAASIVCTRRGCVPPTLAELHLAAEGLR